MGLPPERALSALRLSLGRWSAPQEIETASRLIAKAAAAGEHRASGHPLIT
ncbi:hypothetical protein OOK31_04665 [Streptomyces sp. NBC_00249]|uniref:hypothetical protein n=1 Tax=Streptomyces sp. NBC_00249 TaxID=2975690 RepID=UPI0022591D61|nr:hypothetical protein [Streptomyces sp. NBC_00249]MCX5193189.1 hypothetical protein [Streptomyces sp. NBC_00249]